MKNLEKASKTQLNVKDSEITFSVNPKIYPKDIIFKACYTLIDKIYVYLDSPEQNTIVVSLKTKEKTTKKKLEKLRDEFLNELLNASVRKNISQKNQKIVEYIVGGAINAALPKIKSQNDNANTDDDDISKIEAEIEALKKELEQENYYAQPYEEDPLKIKKTMP